MKTRIIHLSKILTALIVVILLLNSTACACKAKTTSISSSEQYNLQLMQKNGNVTVRLYGVMTFEGLGIVFSFPTEFSIPPTTIEWMGGVFSGKQSGSGPGGEVTFQVHGNVSSDGLWLDSLSFSREVSWREKNTVTSFRVTMSNVPIARIIDGEIAELGVFNKQGSDIQRYINKIEYTDGYMENGKFVPSTNYLAIDWKTTAPGEIPIFTIKFAEGPGSEEGILYGH